MRVGLLEEARRPGGAALNAGATPWLAAMLERRPWNVVAMALANKTARVAWAVMARGETYRKGSALPA